MSTMPLQVDLGRILTTLRLNVQGLIQLVSFGLQASQQKTDGPMAMPGGGLQLMVAPGSTPTIDQVRETFNGWTIANAFRDCSEFTGAYLCEVWKICALWDNMSPDGTISHADLSRTILEDSQEFSRKGLKQMIKALKNEFGFHLEDSDKEDVLSINLARNCLAHSQGFVTRKFRNVHNGLRVTWTNIGTYVEDADGERQVTLPFSAEAVDRVFIASRKHEKLFEDGALIRFAPEEFTGLCWSFYTFGTRVVERLKEHGLERGVKFDDEADGSA